MAPSYEPVATHDDDDHVEGHSYHHDHSQIPNSPPPSFRSRASSPVFRHDPLSTDADRELHDTFDSPSDDEGSDDGNEGQDDRQRLMHGSAPPTVDVPSTQVSAPAGQTINLPTQPSRIVRMVTQLPIFNRGQTYNAGGQNDGVFANLSAKPQRGDDVDEKPPTYEQAAADATPPYWETTILAPGMVSDEVYVDGLPVGSVFSFIWNAMISMSFQIVGFLLTYLLHTTHAAKNGSLAGLGMTLVQFGFSMKSSGLTNNPTDGSGDFNGAPQDPNSHDFDPTQSVTVDAAAQQQAAADAMAGGISTSDWFAYILMIVGWFILIRSISNFLKARRHEQLVLQSPDRGLGTAVVAEGETPATVV
ncbi:metal homeostatis protein Bsd2 [Venturia nashicola]|uniref:Metal homeostatis protein Bsd2 n=1 Tax=Venturia nashicola TaxID=86259 RepID=A0A4Z1NUN7_9PEZI|nr:metal homeostatis protein Bsd2 [Venturia nashicola]TLD20228.1 metal homeostatis protein Bsd2 [Venturia nashicola]